MHHVKKGYTNPENGSYQTILNIDDLQINEGTHAAIAGPSGTGKTTLLHLLSGLINPESGTITIGDVDITKLSESQRDRFRADNIGYVFQSFNLLDGFTALENVQLGMMFSGKAASKSRAEEVLAQVGLTDRLHYKPSQLSVGQQQRVCVARALVNDPKIILADEPTGNLDPSSSAEVLRLLKNAAEGKVLLVVTHESDVISQFERVLDILTLTPSPDLAVK
ncbi:MAG: ABC transporter ATP-binding protein [Balneolales bacterium]|nr:ABC transporter ATP-binding protein [Balneolales bacterium]